MGVHVIKRFEYLRLQTVIYENFDLHATAGIGFSESNLLVLCVAKDSEFSDLTRYILC